MDEVKIDDSKPVAIKPTAPPPEKKPEELDQKQLEAKFDEAWNTRLELVQMILEHEPDKGEDLPDDIFNKIEELNERKDALRKLLPAIEKAMKKKPDIESTHLSVKNAIEGDEELLKVVQDYLAYNDQDAVKYDFTRLLKSKLDYDLTEAIELPEDQLQSITNKPELTYEEFKKSLIKEKPHTPTPITPVPPIQTIKEDSFEYDVSENKADITVEEIKPSPKPIRSQPREDPRPSQPRVDKDYETRRLLGMIDDEILASSLKKKQLEDDFEDDLDSRAAKLREARKKRQATESKLMADREHQIASLVASSMTKTRLLPTQEQSSNIQLFAKAQLLGFEVQSRYTKIKDKQKHVEKIKGEIEKEQKSIESRYEIKDDLIATRQEQDATIHELREQKEQLQRELERKKEETRQARISAGGGSSKNKVDERVEKDLKGIDHLMMVKVLELRREKSKLEDLKNQYEEYLLAEEQKRTDMNRKSEYSSTQMPMASMMLPFVSKEIQLSDLGGSDFQVISSPRYHRPHPVPPVQSELVETPGSKFLDDFNRDLTRLICGDN